MALKSDGNVCWPQLVSPGLKVLILDLFNLYAEILLFFRENLCKYEAPHQPVDSHTPLPLPLHQPHPHQEDIRAEAEHVEDVEVNTTITDKIIDAQNSSIHSKYDMKPNNI